MLTQAGNVVGSFYLMLVPFKHPKRDFFVSTTIKCLAMGSLIFGRYMEEEERKVLYCFLLFVIGLMNAPVFYPSLIMNKYFDP